VRPQEVGVAGAMRPQGVGVVGGVRSQVPAAMGGIRPGGPGGIVRGGGVSTRPAKPQYNQMAPPTNQYTADIAIAVAQNVVSSSRSMPTQVPPPPSPSPPPTFLPPPPCFLTFARRTAFCCFGVWQSAAPSSMVGARKLELQVSSKNCIGTIFYTCYEIVI
jgi:hypothetical protein